MTSIQRTDTARHFDYGANTPPEVDITPAIKDLRCLNDALIIHQLPIELLLSIFESVLQAARGATASIYHRRICALSGVCARWFFIIQHSPALWTTVFGGLKQEGLRKILERSSGERIDVEYEFQGGGMLQDPEGSFMESFNILSSTTGRWRTLIRATRHYSGDRPGDFLQFLAPNLERLVFKSNQGRDMTDVELFGGNCPNLKHIPLDRAEYRWSQAAFKKLESLGLSYLSFDTVEPILDIIRDIPQLKRLEIYDCHVNHSGQAPANSQPVSLPNLQFLRVEFDNDDGVPSATEQLLRHISAPPQCPLYISLAGVKEEEDSFVATFCEWLFGKQTKEVLEGVESFKLGFDIPDPEAEEDHSGTFELFSGSANVKGGIRGFTVMDAFYVMDHIQGVFQRSPAVKPFTQLTLSKCGAYFLNSSDISAPFKEFVPPVTHLELVEPVWAPRDPDEDVGDVSSSPFSTVKSLILREVSPDDILDIVLEALGDPQARSPSMAEFRVGTLEHVEVHVRQKDFNKVEAVVEVLRNDSRIGKVDLYVAL
ncbi:hypothetical protein M407DRAFT_27952 [Tulasnella calospora MUT 4182]|uniref:F-box domain-containing protein n=1 Tax=Tulasnella calospora MUT 4182 TaxID=1051891 RepID=A0A0C3QCZ1_9AGAM|nr:hypothetical protein M407DRAFT_27952 [Tulasnella calospora MUT 4182]